MTRKPVGVSFALLVVRLGASILNFGQKLLIAQGYEAKFELVD